MTESTSPPVALFADAMVRFRTQMEANDRESLAISIRTKWIVKLGGVLLVVMGVAIGVQILSMRSELLLMIENLERMYSDFGVMAKNLDGMTGQVKVIQGRVTGLPSIATDMTAINTDVWAMRTAIGGMSDKVSIITTDVGQLKDTTREMGYHFNNVQKSVDYMSHNVGQMLRPLSVIPR
jgi:DNA anti-recombination protein RmuC